MATKSKSTELSGTELLDCMKKYDNAKEFINSVYENCKEFVKDIETLAHSISNLYEANKVPLAVGGVAVTIEVTAEKEPIFKAHIGDEDSAKSLLDMLHEIAAEVKI